MTPERLARTFGLAPLTQRTTNGKTTGNERQNEEENGKRDRCAERHVVRKTQGNR
jgi:hypothetical protein